MISSLLIINHVKKIYRKTSQKSCELSRILHYLDIIKTKRNSFSWNDKITVQLMPFYLDVVPNKILQLNQQGT